MKKLITSTLFAVALSGCAQTNITGYSIESDNSNVDSVSVIYSGGFGWGEDLVSRICDKIGDNYKCENLHSILPPIKEYTADETISALLKGGVDRLVDIRPAGMEERSTSGGSISTINSNGTNFATVTTNNFSYTSKAMDFVVYVYEVKSPLKRIYTGTGRVSGDGIANITMNAFNSSVATTVTKELKEKNLI